MTPKEWNTLTSEAKSKEWPNLTEEEKSAIRALDRPSAYESVAPSLGHQARAPKTISALFVRGRAIPR
jgi:hypothetical protein